VGVLGCDLGLEIGGWCAIDPSFPSFYEGGWCLTPHEIGLQGNLVVIAATESLYALHRTCDAALAPLHL